MNIGRLAYVLTDILFGGAAVLAIWYKYWRFLKKHWRFIVGIALLSLPFSHFDLFALKWGAWWYNPQRNLGVFIFGEHLESYTFMAIITVAIASYTITHAKVYGYKKAEPTRLRSRKGLKQNKNG
jgi:lycopene cyclase domain-containing protein